MAGVMSGAISAASDGAAADVGVVAEGAYREIEGPRSSVGRWVKSSSSRL